MYDLLKFFRLPIFFLGLILLWVADRYLSAETYYLTLRISGIALAGLGVLATLVLSFAASGRGLIGEAKSWRKLSIWQIILFGGVVGYVVYGMALDGAAVPQTSGQKILLGLWTSLVGIAIFLAAGMEWAMAKSGMGELAEPSRIGRSSAYWLSTGMLFVSLVSLNYVAVKTNNTSDWSYLKTTIPSDATKALAKTITEPVDVALFYERGSEVLGLVKPYFDLLTQDIANIDVQVYDKDISPGKSEEFRVTRNGHIVVRYGEKTARLDTGDTIEKARKLLRRLDIEFQRRFLEVTAERKTAYFTRGHGEMSWVGGGKNPLKSIKGIEGYLRKQNYRLKLFGLGEGSANAVPDDAAVVVIAGPSRPFLETEVQALKNYVEGGGHLMVLLDIEQSQQEAPDGMSADQWPFLDLLASWGFRYDKTPLANMKNHGVATRSPIDRWFILSDIFTSHDSVVSLSRHEERVAIGMLQAGSIKLTEEVGLWKNAATVRSDSTTFQDANKNFQEDKGEKRDSYVLGAVGVRRPKPTAENETPAQSRILVYSDATIISDLLIQSPGNGLYFADGLKWLMGDVDLFGTQSSEEDVRISHTSKDDAIWFNSTVVVVPLTLLGAGFFATRRRGSGRKRKEVVADAA